ncbi:hypothetical protein GQ457_01G033240 [Hibiscus cannabinus]
MPRKKLSDMCIVRDSVSEEETNTDDFIATGSSEVSETVENVEIEGNIQNGERRRTRGRTTLTELYQLPLRERVKVSRNEFGQPIGAEAGVLASYVGIVARNATLLPINHESWRQMPNSNKNQDVDLVKKFSLDVSDRYLKMALGKKWRDNKSYLKEKKFKNNLNHEEKLQNVPLECIHTNGKMQLMSALELLADSTTKVYSHSRVEELCSCS